MKNTLTDLNNYLFEALERINDDELDEEGLNKELKKCDATVKIADKIIQNGELSLKAMQHMDAYGLTKEDVSLPPMLTAEKS